MIGAVGRAVGGLADQDAVDRRRRLQPRRGVDDVAGRHPLAAGGVGTQHDQRLAGVHAHAHVQVEAGLFVVQPRDRGPDRERRAHRPLRIVLVGDRRAEQRHHRVADELLDRAAVVLQLLAQQRVVGSEGAAHVLDVHPLAAAGEADQVGEQHRHHLALLADDGARSAQRRSSRRTGSRPGCPGRISRRPPRDECTELSGSVEVDAMIDTSRRRRGAGACVDVPRMLKYPVTHHWSSMRRIGGDGTSAERLHGHRRNLPVYRSARRR